jgi:hypothetical protein
LDSSKIGLGVDDDTTGKRFRIRNKPKDSGPFSRLNRLQSLASIERQHRDREPPEHQYDGSPATQDP